MKERVRSSAEACSFREVKPIMMELPYPSGTVKEQNPAYAGLLSIDYCGAVSELSSIAQYINNENRLFCEQCPMARTILGIAMAEMIHLQKLGEMIFLLGGEIDYSVRLKNGRQRLWTPEYLMLPEQAGQMLSADLEAERAAINQYRTHIKMIGDDYVNAVLLRIIRDEEYHIMLLQAMKEQL